MKKLYAWTIALFVAPPSVLGCSSAPGESADSAGSAVAQASGPCDAPLLQVIVKEREHRFGFDNRQVALNPAIPIQNICQNFVRASCKAACTKAESAATATGVRGFSGSNVPAELRAMGQLADTFNAALGSSSDFTNHPIDQDPGADPSTDPNASTTTSTAVDSGATGGGATAVSCNATILQVIVNAKEHRFGFDGRQVALNPAIPIQNICQNRVASSCRVPCANAEAAAAATGVKGFSGTNVPSQLRAMGRLADTFNAALGNVTDFADHPIDLDPGVAAGNDPNASTN